MEVQDEVAPLKDEKAKLKVLPVVPDIPHDKSNHQVGKCKSKYWEKKAKKKAVRFLINSKSRPRTDLKMDYSSYTMGLLMSK